MSEVMYTQSAMNTCPRCNEEYTNHPALSRVDNKTAICASCETAEALWEYYDDTPLPPVTVNIRSTASEDR